MAISGKAKLAGVMGWPVAHSLSPRLHGYWLDRHRIDGAYVPLAVPPEKFAAALRMLPSLGFAGANVTVPHKEAALVAVDRVEPLAERIGAANTIVVGADGALEGRNTDAFGFVANLDESAPDWRKAATPAVVLGAGGAARAVVAALVDLGIVVRLVNRTAERAEALAESVGGNVEIVPWSRRTDALDSAGLLVNTTTLGMTGKPALDLALDPLPKTATVNDIVYAPLQTDLLKAAAARGNKTVDGLGMLLHQARPGFAAWFGVEPEVTAELRAFVLGS